MPTLVIAWQERAASGGNPSKKLFVYNQRCVPRFPWKAVAIGGAVVAGLVAAKVYNEKHRRPPPKRVALIGDSYAVGLGPELAKIYPDFKFEGHVGNNTWQWATHQKACGQCGDWLTTFKPDLVLVALGVNDAKPNPTDYQTIVRGLRSIGARVVWVEPPMQRMTNALYDAVQSSGVERAPAPNLPLVDGLHPTGDGYRTWASEIAGAVARG